MTRRSIRSPMSWGVTWALGLFCLVVALVGWRAATGWRLTWERQGTAWVAPPPEDSFALTVEVFARVPVAMKPDGGVTVLERRATAHPLSGVRVSAYHAEPDRRFVEVATAETDEAGRVVLPRLPGGPLWLLAGKDGFARRSRVVDALAEETVRVELLAAARAQVRVEDAQGVPIPGATVLADDADPLPFGALTDAAGVARFARLGSGPWRLSVFAVGYGAAHVDGAGAVSTVVLTRQPRLLVQAVDSEGAPVKDATVLIVGASLWPARYAKVDEGGRATLDGLEPGRYEVRAHAGSEVSPVVSVALESSRPSTSIELVLAPGRMITVAVSEELAAGGESPVASAEVVLSDHGVGAFPVTGKTGPDGRVTLGPVPKGSGVVGVFANGYVSGGAQPVPADAPQPFPVLLHRAATLRGHVTDAQGRPIDGARVEVVGIDTQGLPVAESPLLAAYRSAHFEASLRPSALIDQGELGVTLGAVPFVAQAINSSFEQLPADYRPWVTGFDGAFKATPVPAGRLRALVRHPGYVEGLSAPVEVGYGGEARVTVVLSEGARLRGLVVDEFGRPTAGARVKFLATTGGFEESVITDGTGRFHVNAVPPSIVALVARPSDITRFVSRTPLTLRPGEEEDVELRLPEERGVARVRVLGADERPLELAQVELASVDSTVPVRETRFSDGGGWVGFEDVVGVPATLRVSAPGYANHLEQVKGLLPEQTVTLAHGTLVRGRVTAVRGRVLVAGARVLLTGRDASMAASTDASGVYLFEQVAAGTARLAVTHPDHAAMEIVVEVGETGLAERAFELPDIVLLERAAVEGVVVDSEGRAVSGARVALRPISPRSFSAQPEPGVAVTDGDGRFVLGDAPAAALTVYGYHAAHGRAELRVDALAGRALGVELRLVGGALDAVDARTGGVAVVLGERNTSTIDWIVMEQVATGSEAERAGLRVGDALVSVDGEFPRSLTGARELLMGRAGTDVVVELDRQGEVLSFRVRRELLR